MQLRVALDLAQGKTERLDLAQHTIEPDVPSQETMGCWSGLEGEEPTARARPAGNGHCIDTKKRAYIQYLLAGPDMTSQPRPKVRFGR
jgi:hypothetical protein